MLAGLHIEFDETGQKLRLKKSFSHSSHVTLSVMVFWLQVARYAHVSGTPDKAMQNISSVTSSIFLAVLNLNFGGFNSELYKTASPKDQIVTVECANATCRIIQ